MGSSGAIIIIAAALALIGIGLIAWGVDWLWRRK